VRGNTTGIGGVRGVGLGLPLPQHGTGGNGAGWRGGTFASMVADCTFSANLAAGAGPDGQPAGTGGAISGTISVANSILWDDSTPEIDGSCTVSYSDVEGGVMGPGNLNTDPKFVDAANGNLRLRFDSPCIDVGSNMFVPGALVADLDRRPRIQDGNGDLTPVVDPGAYERNDPSDAGPGTREPERILAFDRTGDGAVRVRYTVPLPGGPIELDVFDVRGRRVRSLVRAVLPAGEHVTTWDRTSARGSRVAAGSYHVRLRFGDRSVARKLVLAP